MPIIEKQARDEVMGSQPSPGDQQQPPGAPAGQPSPQGAPPQAPQGQLSPAPQQRLPYGQQFDQQAYARRQHQQPSQGGQQPTAQDLDQAEKFRRDNVSSYRNFIEGGGTPERILPGEKGYKEQQAAPANQQGGQQQPAPAAQSGQQQAPSVTSMDDVKRLGLKKGDRFFYNGQPYVMQ